MREIIFKGKKTVTGEWIEGYYVKTSYFQREEKKDFIVKPIDVREEGLNAYEYEVIPETVCQFTGLIDKNGKKIFEGDKIICSQYIGGNFVERCVEKGYVEFKYGAFGLHRKIEQRNYKVDDYYRPFKDWLEDYELEVIGNIHEGEEK